MKYIIFLIIYLFSFTAFAKDCTSNAYIPKVEFKTKNLVMDLTKFSKQLESKEIVERAGQYRLGLNQTNLHVETSYSYRYDALMSCTHLTNLQIDLEINPVIYIAKEAQQYSCTQQRVYEHEMNHYKVNMRGLNRLIGYIKGPMIKKYETVFYANSKEELIKKNEQLRKSILEDIKVFYINETVQYHNMMDTAENYQKEQNICSFAENYAVVQLIKNSR